MRDLLIKGALVVREDAEEIGDVLCSGGKIKAIAPAISPGAQPTDRSIEVIDAGGKLLVPGGVDVHTHLNLDTGSAVASDDFYTGTVAAAWGGTTTIVDHPAFGPKGCALDHQISKYHALAEGKAVIDYGFHGVIQHVDDAVLERMASLCGEGITSYKIYLTYDYKLSDADVFRALEAAGRLGALITVHAENDGVIGLLRRRFQEAGTLSPEYHPLSRPAECEAEAVGRMILLAEMAAAPLYIVHLSTALGLRLILDARARGVKNLYAETCPQYLFLDESLYRVEGHGGLKYIMCPPLRGARDRESLWEGLRGGIDTVATDHCPFFFETQKLRGKDDFTRCPSGAPGVEERLPLLFSEGVGKGRITLRRMVELCAANPAKLFGLYPRKGVIREGSDADLVILDPGKKMTLSQKNLHANVDYSAYEGMELTGCPVCVISRGEVIVRDGAFTGQAGRGQFIKRERPYFG